MRTIAITLGVALGLVAGCSQGPVLGPQDTARLMKQAVRALIKRAGENPKAATNQAGSLSESLQAVANNATDENKSTYEAMSKKCREISESNSSSSSDMKKKFDELSALADKLPGDVVENNLAPPPNAEVKRKRGD